MLVVEVIGQPVAQGSTKAIPFHRPCPQCKPGKPCGRTRMCVGGREIGASVMHDNRDELAAWRKVIVREVVHKLCTTMGPDEVWARRDPRPCIPAGSVTLGMRLVAERPQGHWTSRGALSSEGAAHPEPWKKPDLDKLERAILDALTEAGVYKDDAQAATLIAVKDWAPRGEPAKATILIAPGRQLVEVATALDKLINRPPMGDLFG